MGFVEIAVIVSCSLIVGGVIVSAIINKKKGKHNCGCGCDCSKCASCKIKEQN